MRNNEEKKTATTTRMRIILLDHITQQFVLFNENRIFDREKHFDDFGLYLILRIQISSCFFHKM